MPALTRFVAIAVATTLGTILSAADTPRPGIDWPSFRGPGANGVAEGRPAPSSWDGPAGKNIKWRVDLPGLGHSSPIVWGNQICTSSAVSGQANPELKVGLYGDITSVEDATTHQWLVMCFDKNSGKPLWQRTAHTGVPRVKRHFKSTQASSTLATDGRYIIAFFGSEGLFAYDMQGTEVWKKDFGVLDSGFYMVPEAQWGFASSPVIHDNRVVIQVDVQKGSFVAALHLPTGRELWRTPRNEVPTFSTPTVYADGGRAQVILNGWKHIGGYDLETGKELWRMTGGGDIPVPTPIVGNGLIFITNAHGKMSPIYAVRPTAAGDITLKEGETSSPHIAWSYVRDGGYMQTPIFYRDQLYVCRDNGVLSVFDTGTGQRLYQSRLADGRTGFSASAVASDGRLYFTSEEGDVYVVKAGKTFEQIAVNPLGEVTMATPAISEGRMYFRTKGHLLAVGEN